MQNTNTNTVKSAASKSFGNLSAYAVDHNGNVMRIKTSGLLEKKALKEDKEYNRILNALGVRA